MNTTDIANRKKMLKSFLSHNKVQVTFTKVNGDTRIMNCTLNEDLIPVKLDKSVYEPKNKADNPNTIAVYDLDKNAWRSFRIENIIETKLL
jgi:hypothetical protein